MSIPSDVHTISELVADAFAQLGKLVRNEIDLARAELSAKVSKVGTAAGLIGAGVVLMIPAMVLLLLAAAAFLVTSGFSQPVAYLIAGGGSVVVALGLVWAGMNNLSGDALKPKATLHQIERDKAVAKELAR